MSIGVIGNGRFGQLISKYINVYMYDIRPENSPNTLSEVLSCNYIILAVPMRELENTCLLIAPSVNKQIIIDICSLKCFAHEIIKRVLPDVKHVGTHPLFGPQSAKDGIKGQRIVITSPIPEANKVDSFCKNLGLEVIWATPEEHDKQMAASQALVHFIGRAVERGFIQNKIEESISLRTKSYDDMLSIINLVRGGSEELFEDMQTLNPFSFYMRDNFMDCASEIHRELCEKTRAAELTY